MRERLVVTYDVCEKTPIKDLNGFREIMSSCFLREGAITVKFEGKETIISAVEDSNPGVIRVEGGWRRLNRMQSPPDSVSGRILLPLLFHVDGMYLSRKHIYTMGRPHRSVADFLARNLFSSLIAKAKVHFVESASYSIERTGTHPLINHYFYILKSTFRDPFFFDQPLPEIIDLLTLNCFQPVVQFREPLLKSGSERLRNAMQNNTVADLDDLKPQFYAARDAMLIHIT